MAKQAGSDGSCLPLDRGWKDKAVVDLPLWMFVAGFLCGIPDDGTLVITYPAVEREIDKAVKRWSVEFDNIDPAEFKARAMEIVWETLCNHKVMSRDRNAISGQFIIHIRKALKQLEDVALDTTQSRKSYHQGKTYYHPKWVREDLEHLGDKLADPDNLNPETIYIEKEERQERVNMVRAALTHLSALRRAVIDTYMKHGETLSQAQMANIVGISVDAFESRFRRAKASLRKIIEENYKKLVER